MLVESYFRLLIHLYLPRTFLTIALEVQYPETNKIQLITPPVQSKWTDTDCVLLSGDGWKNKNKPTKTNHIKKPLRCLNLLPNFLDIYLYSSC